MNDFEDYIDRIGATADARKPITRAEWQILGVYLGLVLIAALIAFATNH